MRGMIPTDIITKALRRAQDDISFIKQALELVLPVEPEGTYTTDTVTEAIATTVDLGDMIRDLRFPALHPASRIITALQREAAADPSPVPAPPGSPNQTIDESTREPGEPATASA